MAGEAAQVGDANNAEKAGSMASILIGMGDSLFVGQRMEVRRGALMGSVEERAGSSRAILASSPRPLLSWLAS